MGIGRWRVAGAIQGIWLVQRSGGIGAAQVPLWGEPLRGEEAARQVDAWFPDGWGDTTSAAMLAEIAAHLGHERWGGDGDARRWMKAAIQRALRDGRLIAVRAPIPASAGAGSEKEHHDEPAPARREESAWLEISLMTDEDPPRPVPFKRYAIELPNGSTRTGQLDQNGMARLTGIDPGTCQISFPDFDEKRWRRA